MDLHHNLLYSTVAKMDDYNSASCVKQPGDVSRKRQSDKAASSSKKAKPEHEEQLNLQRKMAVNVARIGLSVEAVAFGAHSSQKESLQKEKFDLEMKKLACNDKRVVALIDQSAKLYS